jgi:hypothetical protein
MKIEAKSRLMSSFLKADRGHKALFYDLEFVRQHPGMPYKPTYTIDLQFNGQHYQLETEKKPALNSAVFKLCKKLNLNTSVVVPILMSQNRQATIKETIPDEALQLLKNSSSRVEFYRAEWEKAKVDAHKEMLGTSLDGILVFLKRNLGYYARVR